MGIDSRSDRILKRRKSPHLELNSFHLSGCCMSFWWVLSISSLTSANAALAFSRVWRACSLSVSFKQRSSICCNRFSHSIWGPLSLKKPYTQKPGIRTTRSTQKLCEVTQIYFCNKIRIQESNNWIKQYSAWEPLTLCSFTSLSLPMPGRLRFSRASSASHSCREAIRRLCSTSTFRCRRWYGISVCTSWEQK